MRRNYLLPLFLCLSGLLVSCRNEDSLPIDEIVSLSARQCAIMESSLTEDTMPRTFQNGELVLSDTHWWCSGFFPGSCWYTWRLGGDIQVREIALRQTSKLLNVEDLNTEHDLGFQVLPSAYFAFQETGDSLYLKTVYDAAEKLAGRFSPVTGAIRSWDNNRDTYPVIIDNMMNLELLTVAARVFNRPEWRDIAVTHAQTTLRNHFRPDGSCYHLVDYNTEDGSVIRRQTVQGYSDESAWARGQAWAVYGLTMMYRETGMEACLDQAERTTRYLLTRLEGRPVPPWDFDAPEESIKQDDASAGAIMASAFIELSTLSQDAILAKQCRKQAAATLKALCNKTYLAKEGEVGGFLLKHSTGHYTMGSEVDVPLTYADYYFLEALWRWTQTGVKFPQGQRPQGQRLQGNK